MLGLSCKTIYLYDSFELVYLSIEFVTTGIRTSIRNNCKWYASTWVWLESIKKMQVICKSFYLARKYKKKCKWFASPSPCIWLDVNKRHQLTRCEQETPTKKGGGQCATKEKNLGNVQPKRGMNLAPRTREAN